ncbi:MAG: formylglycine-generating enzyme family protein [Spirochaetales bacterium]|nr:formylglycine-generating enzyme family protein [Spirochaetales bacterium]
MERSAISVLIAIFLIVLLFACQGTPAEKPVSPERTGSEHTSKESSSMITEIPQDPTGKALAEPSDAYTREEQPIAKAQSRKSFIRVRGITDGFVFSVSRPTVRWEVFPEESTVRIEVSAGENFSLDKVLFQETSSKGFVQLSELEEGKEYFLRIGIVSSSDEDRPEVVFKIFYRPFSIPILPVLEPGRSAIFPMGYEGGLAREKPVHPVTLTVPFALGTFEVTNKEFAEVMNRLLVAGLAAWEGENLVGKEGAVYASAGELNLGFQFGFDIKEGLLHPRTGRETHPVVGVSWFGALAFCYYLSIMEGIEPAFTFDPSDPAGTLSLVPEAKGYRIPTEAEWEYAARGEGGILYPGGKELRFPAANFFRSGDPFEGYRTVTENGGPTTPVGYYDGSLRGGYRTVRAVSPFGQYDLLGNVWEWCWDWFDPAYYEKSSAENPLGPSEGEFRSVRGGGWNTSRQDLRFTTRGFFRPHERSYSIGFRIARNL